MVTTSSASAVDPALNFTVKALRARAIPEELEAAHEASACISELAYKLRSVIKYIDLPLGQERGIIVCRGEGLNLILLRNGTFCLQTGNGELNFDPKAWEDFTLSSIFSGLQEALEQAIAKKRECIEVLEVRMKMLRKIKKAIEKTR